MTITPEAVRDFAIAELRKRLSDVDLDPASLGDGFDLMASGVLDSLGMMELIMAVNARFHLDVDFEGIDPEEITVLGPFSRYVAASAKGTGSRRPGRDRWPA